MGLKWKFLYRTYFDSGADGGSYGTVCPGITEEEVKILAATGAVIFHGPAPRANVKSRCPVYDLLRAGAEVAIVTDGTAPDRSFDIWRDMKMFQVIHRIHEHDTYLALFGIMPVQRLVYHAQGNDVDTVIVDGEVMMEGRIGS